MRSPSVDEPFFWHETMDATSKHSEDVSPDDDVDMEVSMLIAYKEATDKLVEAADAEAIALFEEVDQQPTYPTTKIGKCGRCGHLGLHDTICYNCVSYYKSDDLSDEAEESETDSQIAEQLANQFCGSPIKASPTTDEDEDVEEENDH